MADYKDAEKRNQGDWDGGLSEERAYLGGRAYSG